MQRNITDMSPTQIQITEWNKFIELIYLFSKMLFVY